MTGMALACSEASETITMESPILSGRMHDRAVWPQGRLVIMHCAQRLLHEVNDLLRAIDDQIRRHGMKPVRDRFYFRSHGNLLWR